MAPINISVISGGYVLKNLCVLEPSTTITILKNSFGFLKVWDILHWAQR